MRVIGTILKYLQDPMHPLLGPHLWLLKSVGVWHPVMDRKTRLKLVLVYITLGFFFTQYIKCCIKLSSESFKTIIQYAPFHTAVLKTALFLKDHKEWSEVIAYISSVEREELSRKDPKIRQIMSGYIKYSHRLTYSFWILAFITNLSIYGDLYHKVYDQKDVAEEYINIFDGYTPWKRDPPGYYYIFITQSLFANMASIYAIGWDPLVVSTMIFFAGQLRISGIHCKQAFQADDDEECHRNIAECHRFHTALVKYQKIFNSLISPAMFVYLIVISVNLGVCIVEIVELKDDLATFVSICIFVMACMIELLLFYWHSNKVTEESLLVSYNTFQSDWVGRNTQLQKKMSILAYTTNKRLVFKAGAFNEMSLSTYVSILRGTYSFYTLLNKTN